MLQRTGLAAVMGILVLPAFVLGQYGDGYGAAPPPQVVTPFVPGPAFNPMMTPEWQQAGGDYEAWQRLMMQKMAAQEQAAFQQQIQAYQAWAKANPKEAAALEKAYKAQMGPAASARRSATRKKSTTKAAAPAPAKAAKPPAKGARPTAGAGGGSKGSAVGPSQSPGPSSAPTDAAPPKPKAAGPSTSRTAPPK